MRFFLPLFFIATFFISFGIDTAFSDSSDNPIKQLFEKADQGHQDSQFMVGVMYYNGAGVEQDYEKAMHWYNKAADQGEAGAQYYLGTMYHEAQGVEQDYEKAMHWYNKAADQGHHTSMFFIGLLYEQAQGVEQDYEKAIHWYNKASEYAEKQGNMDSAERAESFSKSAQEKLKSETP